MERISNVRCLRKGDKVYLYGAPFCSDVGKYNPFVVKQEADACNVVVFETAKLCRGRPFRQYCSGQINLITGDYNYEDTYIFRGELEPRDRIALYLQGIKDALDWAD